MLIDLVGKKENSPTPALNFPELDELHNILEPVLAKLFFLLMQHGDVQPKEQKLYILLPYISKQFTNANGTYPISETIIG